MTIESFFMNEIYELREEISSLQLKLQQEKLNQEIFISQEIITFEKKTKR